MKKILALCLLLAILSASLLTSCSFSNYKPISLKYRDSNFAPYTDGEPKSFLVDLLNNSKWHKTIAKCDCDYTVMMKNQREISYHSECGTFIDYDFNKSLTVSEEDRVKLNGYFTDIMSETSTPTNHFLRNQAGAEWLREITAEDIAEIKMIWGGGGPLPPVSKTHISSSRNKAVISSIFEEYYWLDSKPVSEESTQIADGGYFIVQFVLNNGETKQLYFINGDFYQDDNDNYFEIARLPVFRDGMNFVTRYGFERQYDPFQIHLIDGAPVCEIPFSEFEFTELTDDIYLGYELPTHYFEIHGERVYFIKGEYFYIGDNRNVYYQLIGNLDELIAEYSITTE